MKLKKTPWWLLIAAKIILARLPLGYAFWRKLGVFKNGEMNIPSCALETYSVLAKIAGFSTSPQDVVKNFSFIELGPGDSVFTAMIAKAHGAGPIWLVDAGDFASRNPADYESMAMFLENLGYSPLISLPIKGIEDVLSACCCRYMTDGIDSLRNIPEKSIDFCMSNAVLEHIPKSDFGTLMIELKRVLKPDGICVHRIDLKDHLGGGLNNLRIPEWLWESAFFSKSGFYTNRIRFTEMIDLFEGSGFDCTVVRKALFNGIPISRNSLSATFRTLQDEDLMVSGFDVVLRLKLSC